MNKRRKFAIYYISLTGNWVVESTINNESKNVYHFKAIVRTRKLARELVKIIKKKT